MNDLRSPRVDARVRDELARFMLHLYARWTQHGL